MRKRMRASAPTTTTTTAITPTPSQSSTDMFISDSVSAFEAVVRDEPLKYCFLHQLFAILPNRMVVCEEVEVARNAKILRQIDLGHELGILLLRERDYRALVTERCEDGKMETMLILERFVERVLDQCPNLCIAKSQLFDLMQISTGGGEREREQTVVLNVLLKRGVIVYHSRDGTTRGPELDALLAFSLPNILHFVQQIKRGRKQVLALMERASTKKEAGTGGGVLHSILVKCTLNRTEFSIDYHVKDLLGLGALSCIGKTADSMLLRKV